MASQVVTDSLHVLEIPSYVRGYHAYKDNWNPVVGKTLVLRREPTNMVDKHAVAVVKDSVVVGHIPYNLAPRVGQFLRRDENKAFAEVTGEVVNRGAGYGQEVPCIYRLYGPKIYVDKMEELVDGMFADGHI